MTEHIFVDESKRKGLVLVAVRVKAPEVTRARATMGALALPGQRRVHFKTERVSRKQQILDVITSLQVTATAYVCDERSGELDARGAGLIRIVQDHADSARLVVERDESLEQHDKRVLFDAVRKAQSALRYDHLRAHEDALLWIPDAVAWAWTAGGRWRSMVEEFTDESAVGP